MSRHSLHSDPLRFAFLASQPLFKATSSTMITSLDVLDTSSELRAIVKALQRVQQNNSSLRGVDGVTSSATSHPPEALARSTSTPAAAGRPRYYSSVSLEPQSGSVSAFRTLLTLKGAAIIHYGGHGDDNGCLLFEGRTGDGVAAPVQPASLRKVFESGRGLKRGDGGEIDSDSDSSLEEIRKERADGDSDMSDDDGYSSDLLSAAHYQTTQLAFVSACHSVMAGQAFVDAGVPHVVATTSQVRDDSVIEFELQFYQALFAGASIQASFDLAVNFLRAESSDFCEDGPCESDGDLFVLLGNGNHVGVALFSPKVQVESYEVGTSQQTAAINLPIGVEPKLFIGRNYDCHSVLNNFSKSDRRLITIYGRKGVGKTSLAIRAVRYSCERKSHFSKVNYISFPDLQHWLKDYMELESRKSSRKATSEVTLKVLCRGIQAHLEQEHLDSSMSGSSSAVREPRHTSFDTQAFFSSLVTDDNAPLAEARGSTSPTVLHSTSTMSLDDSRVLVVLDGVDFFVSRKEYSGATITFINDILKYPQVCILATSRKKLVPLINERIAQSTASSDASSDGFGLASVTRIKDVVENYIECRPLDPYSTALMLIKHMNRKLLLNEMITPKIESVEPVKYEDWIESLSERPSVVRTEGIPSLVKKLAVLLDGKKMDELDEMTSQPLDRPVSERSMQEMIEMEVIKHLHIPDSRCSSLWCNCILMFARLNGKKHVSLKSLDDLRDFRVSWEIFEEALQRCIDHWTKVGSKSSCRKLRPIEKKFVKARLSSEELRNDMVTFDHFNEFCKWWSPSLKTLITLSSEWQCEQPLLLHGFVGRSESEKTLKAQSVGTFLIRLSESKPGWLAITFNDSKKSTKHNKIKIKPDHCLVNVDDKGFTLFFAKGRRSYETLSDLVFDCRKLVKLAEGGDKRAEFGRVISNYATSGNAGGGSNESSNGGGAKRLAVPHGRSSRGRRDESKSETKNERDDNPQSTS